MIVKTIIDNENGKKWEIIKHDNITGFTYPVYTVKYYEFFKACGWLLISDSARIKDFCTKEFIEEDFDIKIA